MSADRVIRVRVMPVWEDVELTAGGETILTELKHRALRAVGYDDLAAFVTKVRGAAVFDETQTLDQIGIPDNAHIILLRRHRTPVR